MLFPQRGSTERTERRDIRLPELRGRDTLHKPIDGHEEEDYCSPVSITAAPFNGVISLITCYGLFQG